MIGPSRRVVPVPYPMVASPASRGHRTFPPGHHRPLPYDDLSYLPPGVPQARGDRTFPPGHPRPLPYGGLSCLPGSSDFPAGSSPSSTLWWPLLPAGVIGPSRRVIPVLYPMMTSPTSIHPSTVEVDRGEGMQGSRGLGQGTQPSSDPIFTPCPHPGHP